MIYRFLFIYPFFIKYLGKRNIDYGCGIGDFLRFAKYLGKNTQRQLAQQTGISLGSMHYCLKALVAMGWVKAGKFTHNPDKSVYLYLLTPEGILQKSKLAIDFLGRKRAEYHRMQQDIARLSKELDDEH